MARTTLADNPNHDQTLLPESFANRENLSNLINEVGRGVPTAPEAYPINLRRRKDTLPAVIKPRRAGDSTPYRIRH